MIDLILIALAILCAGYFIVITIYAGIGTSFLFVWLFFSALCLFLLYGKWYYLKHMDQIPRWIPIFVVTSCLAGVAVLAAVCILVFGKAAGTPPDSLDYVVVLGARVRGNQVSSSLRRRLDRALSYARENPDTILILSGGKGEDETVSEARAMFDYLTARGISPERLLLEERSSSTVENIAFSKLVIEENQRRQKENSRTVYRSPDKDSGDMVPDKPVEVGLVTSDFHVFRAELIAEHWGLEHACGIAADSDPVLFVHLCVRECASILKERLMGNM